MSNVKCGTHLYTAGINRVNIYILHFHQFLTLCLYNIDVGTENGYRTHSLCLHYVTVASIIFEDANTDVNAKCEWAFQEWIWAHCRLRHHKHNDKVDVDVDVDANANITCEQGVN